MTETRRPTVPALDEILYIPLPVLDHGFVRVVDYMGNDASIVQAARVSYGIGTKQTREDVSLIRYLMQHQHSTPFEMAEIKLHVKLPIFVARQWIRHRTANVNEYSARYSVLGSEFYIPNESEISSQSESNRQGRGRSLHPDEASSVRNLLREESERSFRNYHWLLGSEPGDDGKEKLGVGVARELARITLPLNSYTEWYWKIDLHNLLNFLKLRSDQHAQYEIRAYADAIIQILKLWVPLVHDAFVDFKKEAVLLSRAAVDVLAAIIAGEDFSEAKSKLSQREWADLVQAFRLQHLAKGGGESR